MTRTRSTLSRPLAPVGKVAGLGPRAVRKLASTKRFQFFGGLTHRVETSIPQVALTFDDGPVTADLDDILTPLRQRGVSCTFFVNGIGDVAEGLRRLVEDGHELANHTVTHRQMVFVTPAVVRAEVEPMDTLIRAAGHEGEILFRPPWGRKLVVLPAYLRRHRRRTVTWDVAPESWRPGVEQSAAELTEAVVTGAAPGSIILLHPWGRPEVRAAIGPIVDGLRARGLDCVTVAELLSQGSARRQPSTADRPARADDPTD